jgi:hypothetical protein
VTREELQKRLWPDTFVDVERNLNTAVNKAYRIVRLRMSDRKIEDAAEISEIGRVTAGASGKWFGLAPDESPLLARDIITQEVYALEMQWP